ncbi:MAG: sialate O-acetylesterase [Christensenella sp.]|nr:sialate O-acetylesterase [Christensenella sp.]
MGNITLPRIFQDGMVLQRRKPICVWGSAPEGNLVTVRLAGETALAVSRNGVWKAYLPPMEAGSGLMLTVFAGDNTVAIEDVAIGEVWLASGQSNMEFLLRDDADAEEATQIDCPEMRCFEVPKISYAGQENDRDYSEVGVWRKAVEAEARYFSAVGFYFAQKLYNEFHVPVGILNCTWGGTSASVFTAPEYLTGRLRFFLDRASEAQACIDPATELERFQANQRMIDSLPFDNSVPNLAPIDPDESMKAAMAQMDALNLSQYSPFRPCGLYETMLKTVAPYSVSGVIWYQGESDEPFQELYEELMQAMIACWRDLWHEPLPFLQVQLTTFERMVEPLNFVPIRAAQERLTRSVDRVWLVCSMDAGMRYDVHPKHKRPIGERLALQALNKVYGRSILADSPSVEGVRREGSTIHIRFANSGQGLICRGAYLETLDVSVNGAALETFSAEVRDNELLLSAPELAQGTVTVSFCQRPFCEDNLYNSAGLPMLPFVCTIE